MNWVSAHSSHDDFDVAWGEVRASLQAELGGDAHFLMVFVSGHASTVWSSVPSYARASFPHARLCGVSTRGTISSTHLFENTPSLVVMAARFDGASRVDVVHVSTEDEPLRAGVQSIDWQGVHGAIVLVDPFSVDAQRFLEHIRAAHPAVPVMGGVLAGGDAAEDHALWSRTGLHREGALVVLLRGDLRLARVVAQGVVPLGDPLIVMKQRGNLIDTLDEGSPVAVIRSLVRAAGHSNEVRWEELVMGLDEGKDDLSMAPPSYVMRGIIGVDPQRGSLAVDASVRPYQTVRFYLRDPQAARTELRVLLAAMRERCADHALHAALVFRSAARDERDDDAPDASLVDIVSACAPAPSIGVLTSEELVAWGEDAPACHQFSTAVAVVYEQRV